MQERPTSIPLRILRASGEDQLRAALTAEAHDVLPLAFEDAERGEIARTLDPRLAALGPGEALVLDARDRACGPDDIVLVTGVGVESAFATRYAAITGRRVVRLGPVPEPHVPLPRSVTWFCALDETDMASALEHVHAELVAAWGLVPPLGVLTAESPARLSWVLAKQLLPRTGDLDASTTLVSSELVAARPYASLTCVGSDRTLVDASSTIEHATGTILINGHSRPHCGLLPTSDGLMGICGLASGGAGGRCVDGTACHFGEAPRVVLQRLSAERMFFNGCTTAGVGTRREAFVPPGAMVSHAVLRSRVREYVGNVRTGLYNEEDLHWFLGAAALGFSPAECVAIVETARTSTGREVIASTLYFGDATHPAWPVEGVVIGDVVVEAGRVTLRWPRVDRVLIARVPGSEWAELAGHDRLHVHTLHSSNPSVAVLADPSGAASLVLVVPRAADPSGAAPDPVVVELRALAEPIDRTIGGVLTLAIEHMRALEGSPTFGRVVAGEPARLEQELVVYRRAAAGRESLTRLPELLHHWREQEALAARRLDGALVAVAMDCAKQRWSWGSEYIHRVRPIPRPHRATCPSCGAFAIDIDYVDHVLPHVARFVEVCGYCGIVVDLPVWPLRPRIIDQSLVIASNGLAGRVEIDNEGDRPRVVTLGVSVRGAGEMDSGSRDEAELVIAPSTTAGFDFSLVPRAPMRELMQTWVFVASEGAIGLIGRMLLFGREPNA